MDLNIFLTILGVPISIFIISFIKEYPFRLRGRRRIIAKSKLLSNSGFNFYLVGVSIFITTIITKYSISVPYSYVIQISIYALFSVAIGTLNNVEWHDKSHNYCFIVGMILGTFAICHSFYIFFFT